MNDRMDFVSSENLFYQNQHVYMLRNYEYIGKVGCIPELHGELELYDTCIYIQIYV